MREALSAFLCEVFRVFCSYEIEFSTDINLKVSSASVPVVFE